MSEYNSHDLERRIQQIILERTLLTSDVRARDQTEYMLVDIHFHLRKLIGLGLPDHAIQLALQGIDCDLDAVSEVHEASLYKAGVFEGCDRLYASEILGEQLCCVGERIDKKRIAFRNAVRLDLVAPYSFDVNIREDTRIIAAPFYTPDVITLFANGVGARIHRSSFPPNGILIHKKDSYFGEYSGGEDEDAVQF